MSKPLLNYGMVGGGKNAFIGDVHRHAIGLDGLATLVSGCFSSNYENTLETGEELGIVKDRLYKDYEEMSKKEAGKIDFVVIVTPNNLHYSVSKAFLENGIAVVCDKPLTFTVEEAEELKKLAQLKKLPFCVTYTYTGYPTVKHARDMIAKGDIGNIRFVNAEYAQEWLCEDNPGKQAAWRTNPLTSGRSNCVGDIGSHIENMISFVTGLKIKSLSARLDKMVSGRALDDNASIMLEYTNGAKGLYWCSQIAIGKDNGLRFRIYGDKGAIEWSQEDPNYLVVSKIGEPTVKLSRGRDGFYPNAQKYSRIPSGHPEGYFEAFANIYTTFIKALYKIKNGQTPAPEEMDFPTIDMGIDGVRFINKCVDSSENKSAWTNF